MRVLVVAYFELRDSLKCATNALQQVCAASGQDIEVLSYPLLQMKQELGDGDALVQHFCAHWESCMSSGASTRLCVLWWYIGIKYSTMARMIQCCAVDGAMQCMFNWDDPYMWKRETDNEMQLKSSLFDVAFTTCEDSVSWYQNYGTSTAVYVLPGFDPAVHHPSDNSDAYDCDVSICCTNLYASASEYPDQLHPTRYEILSNLANHLRTESNPDRTFTLRIYGPESVGQQFPEFYSGSEVPYHETYRVFSKSRINLCTHVVGTHIGYLSERVSLVLGSGGLLWLDAVPQNIVSPSEAVIIDPAISPVEQVLMILANPATAQRRRYAGYALAMQRLTWAHWAAIVARYMGCLSQYHTRLVDICPSAACSLYLNPLSPQNRDTLDTATIVVVPNSVTQLYAIAIARKLRVSARKIPVLKEFSVLSARVIKQMLINEY